MDSSEQQITKKSTFLSNTSLITYTLNDSSNSKFSTVEEIKFTHSNQMVQWLNVYGLHFENEVKSIISQNNLDEFLINLILDEDQRNKVIELDNCIFLSIKTLHFKNELLYTEQLLFIASANYVWSIQERPGDYFGHIRERIKENKGIIRRKKADYLLYLIIEAIIDNYNIAYEKLFEKSQAFKDLSKVKPTPEFAITIENTKQNLFLLKKAISSLREAVSRIDKIELDNFESHFFTELKEQASFLIDDIDFDLQQFESSINLIFNIQSHQLNNAMKMLTIISVIFIPLTFLAGLYGMNFKYMPELESQYGYFIVLVVMFLIAVLSIFYFKKRKWFD